jgi:hypothetical protein
MPNISPIDRLKASVRSVLQDGLNYYMIRAEDITDPDEAMYGAIQVREFGAGLDVLDLLIEQDGRTFTGPTSLVIVRDAIVRFFKDLTNTSFQLMRRRAADLIDRIDSATEGAVS